MNKLFENPYKKPFESFAGPDKNLSRAPASIDVTDYLFIRSIRPSIGTINTTQCLLWSKLVEALKSHGITDISKQRDFESFVANLQFLDGRGGGTVGRNDKETPVGNDRSGVTGTRTENPNVANVKPDVKKRDDKQKTNRKG